MSTERERRAHILSVAERLLRHYGPQKTTIAEIARAAEVGVGTVYLEFPSKEAIVEELSRERHGAVLDAMQEALRKGQTLAERVRAVFDARLRAFMAVDGEGVHARDLVHCMNPAVKAAHARFKEAELAMLRELLRAADDEGELKAPAADGVSIDDLATALLLAYVSFGPPYVFGVERAEMERRIEAMHALVLHGLVRDGEKGRRAHDPSKRRGR